MADDVKVKPTPIQRNEFDVAIELTKLYYDSFSVDNKDEVAETFLKFYSVARGAHNTSIYPADLVEYMPESLQQILKKRLGR